MRRARLLTQIVVTTVCSRSVSRQLLLMFGGVVLQSRLCCSVDVGSYAHRVVYLPRYVSARMIRSNGVMLHA